MSEARKFDENWLGHNLTIKFEDAYKGIDSLPLITKVYNCLTCGKEYRRNKPRVQCAGETPKAKLITPPSCCRCGEDFPLDKKSPRWSMGKLRLLSKAPAKIKREFSEWLSVPDRKYLCGNCYFDLTD